MKSRPQEGATDREAQETLKRLYVETAPSGRKAASCAELTEAGSQGLMVNRMAAAWALALLDGLLLGTLRVFAVDFDLGWAGVRSRAIDAEALRPWTKGRR